MKVNETKISSSQFSFLFFAFIQCGVFTLSYSSKIVAHDTWLSILAALAISILLLLIYLRLAGIFPDKSLMQINDVIYGRFLGKLISILYLMFFLSTIAANLWLIGSFWTSYLMPETPRPVFVIMLVFVCVWAVRKGIEVIAKCSIIVTIISIVIVVFSFVLLLKRMNIRNLLPIMDIPLYDFFHSVHVLVSIPFCEFVVFLMVIPHTNKTQQVRKAAIKGLVFGGVFLLTIAIRDSSVLGLLEPYSNATNFMSIRQINIGEMLTRLDILVAIGLMLTVFIKICVFLYATVDGIAEVLNMRSYLPLVVPVAIIGIIYSLIIFKSDMEQAYYGMNIWPFYTIPFEVLIPILSLVIAKMRRLDKREEGKN